MSKNAKDLAGLFAVQKKGKKPTKKGATVQDEVTEADETLAKAPEQEKVQDNSDEKADLEETKETTAPKQAKPAQDKKAKKKDFIHGSDDEDENLDLDKDQNIKIRTTAEVQAERIAQESKDVDMVNGFGLERAGESQTQKEGPSIASAAVKAPSDSSNIKFSGKPTFVNKKKQGTSLNKSDFPELGTVSEMQEKGSAGPKESRASEEDDFGPAHPFLSSAARSGGGVPRQEQSSSGAPKMPFFTSSKKKNLGGGADLAEIANSKQNYDMSFLSSTVKGAAGTEDNEGQAQIGDQKPREQRQQKPREGGDRGFGGNFTRGGGQQQVPEDLEGFEIVTTKKRSNFGTNSGGGEMSFGRPTFSRSTK